MYVRSLARRIRSTVLISWRISSLASLLTSPLAATSPTFLQRRTVTLGELAKAFSELGTSTESDAGTTAISQVQDSYHDVKKTSSFSIQGNQTSMHEEIESPGGNRILTKTTRTQEVSRFLTKERWQRRLFAPSTASSHGATQPLLNLSLAYAQHLRTLSEADLTAEVTKSYRRLNYGNMIQCLIEVWRRLEWLASTVPAIGIPLNSIEFQCDMWDTSTKFRLNDGDSSEEGVKRTTTSCGNHGGNANTHRCVGPGVSLDNWYIAPEEAAPRAELNGPQTFRTDRLLEAVLRCLCKMDLIELEPKICAWIEHHMEELHLAQGMETDKIKKAQGPSAAALPHTGGPSRSAFSGGKWVWGVELYSLGVSCHYAYPWSATFEFADAKLARVPIEDNKQHLRPMVRAEEASLPSAGTRFLHKLSEHLLRWLLMRVSTFDAETSVTVLHLVAQQRLLFSDALLETLADNIGLGIHRLDMHQLSVLIDAIHRYQMGILNVKRWRDTGMKAEGDDLHRPMGMMDPSFRSMPLGMPTPSPTSYQDSSSIRNSSQLPTPTPHALHQGMDWHPIVNEWLYNSVVEQMILLLSRHQQGDHVETGDEASGKDKKTSSACFAGWSQISPTGFLFLTRALARLTFFHPRLIPSMLPGLAAFLRRHPEPYLGIVLLLGRRENCVIDAEVVYVLLKNLTTMLERRSDAKVQAPTRGASDGATGMDYAFDILNLDENQVKSSVGDVFSASREKSHALAPRYGDDGISGGDEGGERQLMLLCDEYCYDGPPSRGLNTSGSSSFVQASALRYRVGLIDVYVLPTLIRSISRLFRLALKQDSPQISLGHNTKCTRDRNSYTNTKIYSNPADSDPAREAYQDVTREALQRAMTHFLRLLYTDAHRGISSLEVLEHDFPLAAVQRLLFLVLDTNRFMEELVRPPHSSAVVEMGLATTTNDNTICHEETNVGGRTQRPNAVTSNDSCDSISVLVSHAFVVELTYVWARQIGSHFSERQRQVQRGSLAWQQQVLYMVDQLQRGGVLKRIEYQSTGKLSQDDGRFQSLGHVAFHADRRTVVRYVIPDELISKHPRVASEINHEKERISHKLLDKQREKWNHLKGLPGDRGVLAPVLKTSAVFAPFSRVLNALRRQEGNYSTGS
ncbi:unnamed protein product [Phytomonas sp. EM1]|nr:unnamed protein product [Phytomonas sp. EM1]|eukprot:CCW61451.1 unnamed protein product [Phytomonas sp. isolate EM1]